jgi:carboxypeptidase PM20D1
MDLLISLLVLFIVLVVILFIRALKFHGRLLDVQPVPIIDFDLDQVTQHLSEAIQIKSVSKVNASDADQQPFIEMKEWIEKTYPLFSKKLERVVINKYSLLFKWVGSDEKLNPILFNAHMDVVPVDVETLGEWDGDPFSGKISDGYIWGRGTLDMKNQLIAILDSVEGLLKENYSPKRTIFVAFGHDEEISGLHGSTEIVKYLKDKNIKFAAVLDEGGMLSEGMLEGVDEPVALVGITEKGYVSLNLTAQGKPGHSSIPPKQTAIGVIARAVALLDDHPMAPRLDFIIPLLRNVGNLLPFKLRFVIANAWLFRPILIKQFSKLEQMNAMIRTTHAATIIKGGIKDNILPAAATATVNCRLLPGDSIQDAIDHFKKVINDSRVDISIDKVTGGWEASIVSPTNTPAYLSLDLVTRQVFNNVTVAPFAFLAATDSRYYAPICKNIYKFSPIQLSQQDRSGIHGINERISIDGMGKMVVFFARLIKVWGEAEF